MHYFEVVNFFLTQPQPTIVVSNHKDVICNQTFEDRYLPINHLNSLEISLLEQFNIDLDKHRFSELFTQKQTYRHDLPYRFNGKTESTGVIHIDNYRFFENQILVFSFVESHLTDEQPARNGNFHDREKLELALTVSELGVWEVNSRTGNIYIDDKVREMLGLAEDVKFITETDWFAAVHPDDKANLLNQVVSHELGETPFIHTEHRIRHAAGHWVWLKTQGKIVERGEDNIPLRVIGTMSDITRQKNAIKESEDLMQSMEKLFRRILDKNPVDSAATNPPPAVPLTNRQKEIIKLISQGLTSQQIAKQLNIATGTVLVHRRDIMKQLNLHNVAELTKFALRHDLSS